MIRLAVALPGGGILELPPLVGATLAQTISFDTNGKLTKSERKFVWNCLGKTGPIPRRMTLLALKENVLRHFPEKPPT